MSDKDETLESVLGIDFNEVERSLDRLKEYIPEDESKIKDSDIRKFYKGLYKEFDKAQLCYLIMRTCIEIMSDGSMENITIN